ncbi:MAG: ORF6N domain-containing protein [Pseudomonadota bacterium]
MAKSKKSPKSQALTLHRASEARNPVSELIVVVRGQPVILAPDLANLYGTTTSAVNQYRRRNEDRFTSDYAFQLTREEWDNLKSQEVMSSRSHGGRRIRPWAYTEHGVAMMSMGMKSEDAVRLSKVIIDTFVRFRRGELQQEPTLPGPEAKKFRRRLQKKIFKQMESLLDTSLPSNPKVTLREELGSIATNAIGSMKAVIAKPTQQSEKMSAEVAKILAEAEKLYAETRKLQVEADAIAMQNYRDRLSLLRELREMSTQLERDDWMDVFQGSFGEAEKRIALPQPDEEKD